MNLLSPGDKAVEVTRPGVTADQGLRHRLLRVALLLADPGITHSLAVQQCFAKL